jgi:hypothetical protein
MKEGARFAMKSLNYRLHDQLGSAYGPALPEDWKLLTEIALAAHADDAIDAAIHASEQLLAEYRDHGCFKHRLLREALALTDLTAILFYNRLYLHTCADRRRPASPVAAEPSPAWMTHADFCFVNVRATALAESEAGNFLDATRILPLLRSRAIHLAPFFENVFGIVYAQDSFAVISDQVTHPAYEAQGFGRYQQLRYFIDCCHLLGKAVGFDLTAHTSGFSKLSFDRPELFRWVRFTEDYAALYDGQSIDEQYHESTQAMFADHIRDLARGVYRASGITCLENTEQPPAMLQAAFREVKQVVRAAGYYPVVPHTWNGIGLPAIKEYNTEGGYPIWDYRDIHGEDQSAHGMGIHAGLKFHTNLVANRSPHFDDPDWRADSWEPTMAYLSELFPSLHRSYGFDFLRIDYVDHIFKATIVENGDEIVLCEQPSPSQLKRIADAGRACFPACGMLADHVGNDIDLYREAGFTVILGKEVQYPLHKYNVLEMFNFNHRLQQWQADDPLYGTVLFPIDTHDMGHFALLGCDLAEREGRETILLRHLFARFATAGLGQRPKYEVMGNQDGSTGIHRVNNRVESLRWGEDRALLAGYHAIEDLYEQCRADLLVSAVTASYVFDEECWWRIDHQSGAQSLLMLTWHGDHYDHSRAGTHAIHTPIPLPRPAAEIAQIEPLLGITPAAHAHDTNVLLPHDRLEWRLEADQVAIDWPRGSSWVVRVRYR